MARVELKNISKHWDKAVAVDDINLTIEDGEFLSLLGPSGCGKSTTLLMLAGIYMPSAGDIKFDNIVVNDIEARQRNISIVFQSYALYPNMTALQNIMFPLRFQKVENAEGLAREMAELVQVTELLARRPSEMSGGQQQRVALARQVVAARAQEQRRCPLAAKERRRLRNRVSHLFAYEDGTPLPHATARVRVVVAFYAPAL